MHRVVGRCVSCHFGFDVIETSYEFPENDVGGKCPNCRAYTVMFYRSKKEVSKEEMATIIKKAIAVKKETKETKEGKDSKTRDFPRSYGPEVRQKCINFAKEGKSLSEIVKLVQGPRPKAIMRYCHAANVTIQK